MKLYLFSLLVLTLMVSLSLGAKNSNAGAIQLLEEAKIAMQSELDSAEELIESALELDPDNSEIQFICGRIMGQQAEEAFFSALSYAKKSVRCLKSAVALSPQDINYRKGLISFYLRNNMMMIGQ